MKIGIPQALFYFRYGQFWEQFFQNLGFDVIISPKTNKQILEKGLKKVSSEICLPIKIICGHIDILKDSVDAIFLPRFIELNHGLYTCPKMIGIVDLARMQVGPPKADCEILSPKIKDNFMYAHFLTGLKLTRNPLKVAKALNNAIPYLTNHKKPPNNDTRKQKILLLSHFYNLCDDFIGKDIISSFEDCGLEITTKEDLPETILKSDQGFAKNIRWVYERELYNAFYYNLDKVDGICNIISFGCGPDSLIGEIMINEAAEKKVPFLQLIIDEHTSKTGVNTRIEAFSEIIKKRKATKTQRPQRYFPLFSVHSVTLWQEIRNL
jgi:predicted nucleotide-binding protein (sugar kinase/HSP70/actin superfamily)